MKASYKTYDYWVKTKPSKDNLQSWLNNLGSKGWQLVYHNDGHTFIFMREIIK